MVSRCPSCQIQCVSIAVTLPGAAAATCVNIANEMSKWLFEWEPQVRPCSRQVWATFMDDAVGPATYKQFGGANYMWASDFPHSDSTWPESRKVVERELAGVPEDLKRKIVYENAAALYHIN